MKKLSAGVIFTDGNKFLVCHVTGRKFYDIPKGLVKPGEEPISACIREAEEETGIKLESGSLQDLGVHEYTREKDLHLFLMMMQDLPSLLSMKCCSYFSDKYGRKLPEIDSYKYISFENKHLYLVQSMVSVIKRVQNFIPKEKKYFPILRRKLG